MKKQSALTANMTGGLNVSLDPSFLPEVDASNLSCVRFDKGLIKKDVGRRAFANGANIGGYCMFIDTFPMRDGALHYLFTSLTDVFRYISANKTFVSINAANSNFTGNSSDRFCSSITQDANGSDLYIITNGKDAIKKWIGTGNLANLDGLANIANSAKLVSTFKNRCILLHTIEGGAAQPTRVRWSALGNPEEWSNSALGCGFVEIVESPDWITGVSFYKERFIIWKERSVWELIYVGYPDIFKPVRLLDGVGLYGQDFPISLGDSIIFYGTDGFYKYDTYTLNPISDKIYPLLFASDEKIININQISKARATYIEELGEYWLSVPTVGEVPDTVLKVDVEKMVWTKRNQEITAFGFYSIEPGIAWQDGVGTWANQTGPWMADKATSGAPTTLMGDSNGLIWEDNRLTASDEVMIYETKDYMWSHAQRITEIRIEARLGPFSVSYSTDSGITWSTPKEFAYVDEFTEFTKYCNITTKKLRIRITSTADWCEIKWVEPWYIPRQRTTTLSTS